jgi:hypothetical protein
MAISVSGSLLVDDLDLIIQAALDGAGLAWVAEDRVAPQLASGTLMRVLEDWCPPFPGFFLYYRVRSSSRPRSRLSSRPSVYRLGPVARRTVVRGPAPRETLANLSTTRYLRCISDQPGSKITQTVGEGAASSTR